MGLFSDISNFVNNELGLDTSLNDKGQGLAVLPWEGKNGRIVSDFDDVFFAPTTIDPNRWNKLYPYRLLVVDTKNGNSIVGGQGTSFFSSNFEKPKGETGIEYIINQEAVSGRWEAVLPISPQMISIQDQFSINVSATMRGIVEEHNGIKFKTITIAGTTGIWPKKPTRGGSIKSPSSLGSIFGGTLENVGGLAESVRGVARAFDGNHPNPGQPSRKPEDTSATEYSTGYYQALYIGQFLERYAQLKKNPAYKNYRLVLDIPKDNQSFVVTPVSWTSNKNQQRPNEYLFNGQFKAWKRIRLNDTVKPAEGELPDLDANTFQKILSTINQTRRTLAQATDLIKAVRSDFQGVFNILRQVSLAVKDVGGLAFAASDLPRQIVADLQDTIEDSLFNIKNSFQRGPSLGGASRGAGGSSAAATSSAVPIKSSTAAVKAGTAVNAIVSKKERNEGLSSSAVSSGAIGGNAAQDVETDPLNEVFDNPEENFDLFDSLNVDDLTLTPAQQDAVDDEIERIRLLTVNDFREFKEDLLNLALDISNNYGAGNETYSDVYGTAEPRDRAIPMSVEENEILVALFESISALDLLTATKKYDDLNIENPLEFVGGLADEAGIVFEDFPSKILVPIPFGLTIEEIAARYMSDSDKWVEIVTLNKLAPPYIDEEGFSLDFLSNAEGRQFTVDADENILFVGQKIILQSDTVSAFSRKIISVEDIDDDTTLVTVDGLANLDTLTTTDNARMQGYLPGTVNSQNQIYIPVSAPSEEDDRTFEITHLDEPSLTKLSKIDFLLTDNMDIAINSVGDFRLANGLTNLVQALKLKIKTRKGTLLRHLDFGLGLDYGVSVADIESGAIIEALNEMVKTDPRFSAVQRISLTISGPTLGINMSVAIANGNGIVPINFDVRM